MASKKDSTSDATGSKREVARVMAEPSGGGSRETDRTKADPQGA